LGGGAARVLLQAIPIFGIYNAAGMESDRFGKRNPHARFVGEVGLNTERNKRIVEEFLQASAVHDAARFAATLCDDATYWTCGKPHLFAYAGERSKAEICAYMSTPSIFVGGVTVTFGAITAEDNRVAVEAQTRGVMPDGRVYSNVYHYLFMFRDEKILRVKEYLDTQSAAEFFSR
jgi:ketosteroid isomerase-like protein